MKNPYIILGGECPKDGQPIAICRGGKNNGEIIYLVVPKPRTSSIGDDNAVDSGSDSDGDDNRPLRDEEMSLINRLIEKELSTIPRLRSRDRIAKAEIIRRNLKCGGKISNDKTLNEIRKIVLTEFQRKRHTELELLDSTLEPVPLLDTREIAYIAGPSGSGKSYYTKNYAKNYNSLFPDNKIVLISKVTDDVSLKGLKNVVQVELDYSLVDDPLQAKDFKDCLVIFDDTDTIIQPDIKKAVNLLKGDILETGRHNGVYSCITSHLISNYKDTRTILNEAHSITVYPSSGSSYQIAYVMKQYFGLDKKTIDKLLSMNSRWITLKKNYPQLLISEHAVILLGKMRG